MDLIFQKARFLAQETAKRSQDFAKEAAKLSQEFALETAKKSKELAVEATKKADQLKSFASGELLPANTPPPYPSEAELEVYGITTELQEFVRAFKIRTFREYPVKDLERDAEANGGRQDLTEWQEKHAVLLLQVVPEISDFRYVLCPRRMKESLFWRIYFKLVQNYIAPYEARANISTDVDEQNKENRTAGKKASSVLGEKNAEAGQSTQLASIEHDLDAYLLGAPDNNDEIHADDGSDADFDQLVNSTGLDSECEDEDDASKKAAGRKVNVASEGSSDGELVEIPSESDHYSAPRESESKK